MKTHIRTQARTIDITFTDPNGMRILIPMSLAEVTKLQGQLTRVVNNLFNIKSFSTPHGVMHTTFQQGVEVHKLFEQSPITTEEDQK